MCRHMIRRGVMSCRTSTACQRRSWRHLRSSMQVRCCHITPCRLISFFPRTRPAWTGTTVCQEHMPADSAWRHLRCCHTLLPYSCMACSMAPRSEIEKSTFMRRRLGVLDADLRGRPLPAVADSALPARRVPLHRIQPMTQLKVLSRKTLQQQHLHRALLCTDHHHMCTPIINVSYLR